VKESTQLTPRRQGAKTREEEVLGFLCELCVLCGLRETGFSVNGLIHNFNALGRKAEPVPASPEGAV
jgi:hypothetical protein